MHQISHFCRNFILGIMASLLLVSCANKVSLSDDQKSYAGRWQAADGTYLHIYLDGGGDFEASNSSVKGGATTIEDNSIKIGLGPINKTFQIDQEPQASDGEWIMVLDGNTYTRQ